MRRGKRKMRAEQERNASSCLVVCQVSFFKCRRRRENRDHTGRSYGNAPLRVPVVKLFTAARISLIC